MSSVSIVFLSSSLCHCKSKHLIYECGFTNSRILKTFLTLIQKRTRHLRLDTLLSLVFRFSYVFPPLTMFPLFFFSSLHCLRAIGKHCLPFFFFMPLLRSCLGRFFVCFLLCLTRRCCRLTLSYICVSLEIFLFAILDFHWDEIRKGMIWMHQEIKRNTKIMIMLFEKDKSREL